VRNIKTHIKAQKNDGTANITPIVPSVKNDTTKVAKIEWLTIPALKTPTLLYLAKVVQKIIAK